MHDFTLHPVCSLPVCILENLSTAQSLTLASPARGHCGTCPDDAPRLPTDYIFWSLQSRVTNSDIGPYVVAYPEKIWPIALSLFIA